MDLMQLVAEGKLALDVPIAQYLPDYPKANAGRITLHHLLSHSSGTPNYTDFPNYREMMVQPHSTAELLRMFADSTLAFTPGERFAYSNSGYMVLGAIVERITGMSYEQALQERIFTPLGMASSGVDNGRTVLMKRASGYDVSGSTVTNACSSGTRPSTRKSCFEAIQGPDVPTAHFHGRWLLWIWLGNRRTGRREGKGEVTDGEPQWRHQRFQYPDHPHTGGQHLGRAVEQYVQCAAQHHDPGDQRHPAPSAV
ncbi:MAG: beta-lactamase family protein [Flavobacteriales bacterium]|nr:beta-lactamase family protein [Flavobacteriales bacterium]